MFKGIDLFSDTATRPSDVMKQAMFDAPLGDEQLGEDLTTKKLEEVMAKKLGLSAALFLPSATMANQIAVKLHTEAGDEVIGYESSHVFNAEAGAMAFHSHVQARMVPSENGFFGAADIKKRYREKVLYNSPRTSLLVVENTTNAGGGQAWPLEKLKEVTECAKDLRLKTHLDGSRIFNASVKSGCSLSQLAHGFNSVTICFSKALGCPAGACLVFEEEHFHRVRRLKQMFGGSLRQSGMFAAAALFALDHHVDDIALDHQKASILAEGFSKIPAIKLKHQQPSTNMIFFSLNDGYDANNFYQRALEKGLRFSYFAYNQFRAVTHRDVSMEDISQAVKIVEKILI
ncbi:MAG: aminotransferase class I/II-fold pyridoxal phosphate-dependent enzyme [Myxococcales bacterium]|nr:aminotransferase class I/II-fold pyridoxal phosphate-dependent enzyme [Myxococcales bacterium]USN50144.1 MAG: aminotransferase class I/II-fold pyridoxal phosphate-dependent enzyme [Myxococcales bacterium]